MVNPNYMAAVKDKHLILDFGHGNAGKTIITSLVDEEKTLLPNVIKSSIL